MIGLRGKRLSFFVTALSRGTESGVTAVYPG